MAPPRPRGPAAVSWSMCRQLTLGHTGLRSTSGAARCRLFVAISGAACLALVLMGLCRAIGASSSKPCTAFLPAGGPQARPLLAGGSLWGIGSGARCEQRTAMYADTKLYDLLGVSSESTVSEIKKAYYKEARKVHPDLVPDADPEMKQRFQEVAEAYQTLADPVRRQQYDLAGLAGLASMKINATRLFGPPPWRVLLGRTDHWIWEDGKKEAMMGLLVASIPNGIAGVTIKTLEIAYEEAYTTRVATLLDRVSENQAKDTVSALEEYGLAVKAEPIEGEQSHANETPLQYFRRMQSELHEASESLRAAILQPDNDDGEKEGRDFEGWVEVVRELRSELRAAAKQLEEFKMTQTS
mmetsp:Transcript_35959/g.78705  ORF Transcript_35959/g.78705 Transcript_35959/m.78705 type:complete len:355 (-) Transcript_35959:86-1150(-)